MNFKPVVLGLMAAGALAPPPAAPTSRYARMPPAAKRRSRRQPAPGHGGARAGI